MRIISSCFIACTIMLTGCNFEDIKDAVADIDNAAEKASVATSEEVHSIRAIELSHNDKTFTVNDLFKGILRDVYWYYEELDDTNILKIKGTWQPALFESYGLTTETYPQLDVTGDVTISLSVVDGAIIVEDTAVTVVYEDEQIFEQSGADILTTLYDEYTKK